LTLQEGRIGRRLWQEWIGAVPAVASMSDEVSGRIVDHLVAEGWLFDEQGLFSIGPEAERSLGWPTGGLDGLGGTATRDR